MFSENIKQITQAIINCTDIIGEETAVVAKNVIIYTIVDYG